MTIENIIFLYIT